VRRHLKLILIVFPIFLLVALPVFAFNSSDFLAEAQKYANKICNKRNPFDKDSLLCYLFARSNEQDSIINEHDLALDSQELQVATMTAQITDLQQRVEALENSPTPTLTPTPTLNPTLLSDDFSGPNLDTNIWEYFNSNGGNYSFDNGSIVVPGGSSMFYIRTKNNPFPALGSFTVEFGIQFTSPLPSGIGLALGFQQQNGYDPNNIPVSFWEDSASGLNVSRFGLNVADLGGIDTNYHVGKIIYDGDKYLVYNDGLLKYTSPSSATAKTIWFGNPYCCSNTWTGLKLDYIKVTQP